MNNIKKYNTTRWILKFFFIIAIFTLIGWMGMVVYKKVQSRNIAYKNIQGLPNFIFVKNGNQLFSNADLKNIHNRIIINYFSPDCEHCQYMVSCYLKNVEKLKNVEIVMVTVADSIRIAKFISYYRLDTIPNIVVLDDKEFKFPNIFGSSIVPSFFIYKDKKLVKKIIGETKIENLLTDEPQQ